MNNYENKNLEQLHELFLQSCKKGDLKEIKKLLNDSELKDNVEPRFILNAMTENIENLTVSSYLSNYIRTNFIKKENTQEYNISELTSEKYLDLLKKAVANDNTKEINNLLNLPNASNTLNNPQINHELLSNAVDLGNTEAFKTLINFPIIQQNINIHKNNDDIFVKSCTYGHDELVDYLLNSPFKPTINNNIQMGFRKACMAGKLDVIKCMVNSKIYMDANPNPDNCLSCASQDNHSEVVKYLFNEPKYQNKIHDHEYQASLMNACYHGDIDLIKFFIDSPKFSTKVNINTDTGNDNQYSFSNPIIAATKGKNREVLEFLIFEKNAEKTHVIEEYLQKNPNQMVENMFNIREISVEIQNELPINLPKKKDKPNKL